MSKSTVIKTIVGFVVLSIFLGLVFWGVTPSYAQDTSPTPTPGVEQVFVSGNELTFEALGMAEETMHGPYDNELIRFSLPADWRLSQGAAIQLDLSFYYDYDVTEITEETSTRSVRGELFGGLIQVVFNDVTISTILLDERGDQSFDITIPTEALQSPRGDGRNELELVLISDEGCLYGVDTIVVVRPSSRFILPHDSVPITTDLATLPRPFYQKDLIVPNQATLAIPDQPSLAELHAAMIVMAGFGRMSNGEMLLSFVPASQLTPEIQNSSHLIFVGTSGAFPSLDQATLPVAPTSLSAAGADSDDGVLETAVSPWNPAKALLVLTSDTDQGLTKAAKALSSGLVMGVAQPDLAFVSEVQPAALSTLTAENRTFKDLGYATETVNRWGVIRRGYEFYIPPGQTPSGETYLDLFYAHSALVHFERSGLVVDLNNEPVGSVAFTEETASGAKVRVNLPRELMRTGTNRIVIEVGLVPRDICADFYVDNLWVSLDAKSVLHVPLAPIFSESSSRLIDLSLYPNLLSLSPEQGSVAFVLPQNDLSAWRVAAQIAFHLGDMTDWGLAEFGAYYGDDVPTEIRENHDLVIVGRASTLPIVSEMGAALPASFSAGSDFATLQDLQVVYRLPESARLGYLELLESPWNQDRLVLAVLGSNEQGVAWAGNALTVPELSGNLAGDLALVSGERIVTADTRTGVGVGSALTTAVPETEVEVSTAEEAYSPKRPAWVLPAIGVAIVLMVVVAILAGLTDWLKRRKPTRERARKIEEQAEEESEEKRPFL